MAQDLPSLAFLLVQVLSLAIGGLFVYYVYKQKLTAYGYSKALLIAMIMAFMALAIVDLLRTSILSMGFVPIYAIGDNLFAFAITIFEGLFAVLVLLHPFGVTQDGVLETLRAKKAQASLLATFVSFYIAQGVYLVLYQPFVPGQVTAITGLAVPIPVYSSFYVLLQLIGTVLSFVYIPALLFSASRKAKDLIVRRALAIFGICWIGLAFDFFLFHGLLLSEGVDATPFGLLIASILYGVIAIQFRRASILTGMFEPIQLGQQPFKATYPFTSRLGIPRDSLGGKSFLLETDPTMAQKQTVMDLAVESLSNSYMTYIFTTKGSPLYNSLSKLAGVRFFLLSSNVTAPKPGDQPYEVLLPNGDLAVLLDVIERTTGAESGANVAIVFDSISDMILSWGLESSYKFLKQLNELVYRKNVVSMFLMTLGAHDQKTTNIVRNLFANQLAYSATGLKITRASQA